MVTDALEFVKYMLQYRGGGLGMQIVALCGFASYMTHIGANNVVVKQFSKPLAAIKSPCTSYCGLHRSVSNVASSKFCSRPWCSIDGDPIPNDDSNGYFSPCCCRGLCFACSNYPFTNVWWCGYCGWKIRNVSWCVCRSNGTSSFYLCNHRNGCSRFLLEQVSG